MLAKGEEGYLAEGCDVRRRDVGCRGFGMTGIDIVGVCVVELNKSHQSLKEGYISANLLTSVNATCLYGTGLFRPFVGRFFHHGRESGWGSMSPYEVMADATVAG